MTDFTEMQDIFWMLCPCSDVVPECFYYAGGVTLAIMEEIKEHLHLDVMTVTGKTLGENLEELKNNGFYEKCEKWLQEFNKRYNVNLTKEDIIRPYDKAPEQMEVLRSFVETWHRKAQ